MKFLRLLLFPFALLFGLGVTLRNFMYNVGMLSSQSFDIPIIAVGNLSVGGTGKTPHTEYLVQLLKDQFKVATLSRGYGRKTSGFILATSESGPLEVGDEPAQIKRNFSTTPVAVDEKRVRGIGKLQEQFPDLDSVILDDAFQHRKVEAGLSILLTEFSNLYVNDFLVPTGNLREWRSAAKRADIIIVTKSPAVSSKMERRIIAEKLKLHPHQRIFFSYLEYGDFVPLYSQEELLPKEHYFKSNYRIALFTGIARPSHLFYYLKGTVKEVQHLKFSDHHTYTRNDAGKIRDLFDNIAFDKKLVLTTEKDAMRLSSEEIREVLKDLPIFYLPIKVRFHDTEGQEFNELIIDYVRKNQVHSRIYKQQAGFEA